MAFTVNDYNDLVRLLAERPEWRVELRRLVLSDELLALPEIARQLVAAHERAIERLTRTEERLTRLEATVQSLAEAQQRAEERLTRLEATVQSLVEQVSTLVEAQRRLTEAVGNLKDTVGNLQDMVGDLKGWALEGAYREHAAGYFGRWLKRVRVVAPETLEETFEATLSHDDLLEVLRLDLLVSGRLRTLPQAPEVWLAVELAAVVNEADIDRAMRRAALLRRAGYRALPVVAGERLTHDAEVSARVQNVVVMRNGTGAFWDEALTAWVKN